MPRVDPKIILADSELLQLLGEINLEWDEIEIGLWRIFDALLPGVRWHQTYAAFFVHQNHRARREMVEALASVVLWDREELKAVKAVLARIKRAARKRNALFHGAWVADETKIPKRIPTNFRYQENEAISRSDLIRTRDQITKLQRDLNTLTVQVVSKNRFPGIEPESLIGKWPTQSHPW